MKKFIWIYSLSFYLNEKNRIIYPGLIRDIQRTNFFGTNYKEIPILLMRNGFSYYIFSDRPLQFFSTPRTRPKFIDNIPCLVLNTQAPGRGGPLDLKRPSSPSIEANEAFIESFLSDNYDVDVNRFLDNVFSGTYKTMQKIDHYSYLKALNYKEILER